MKRIYIMAMALILAFSGYAQKKPKINKANMAREKGDLAEAKEIIDQAIVYEKTKDDGRTWYYRGLIYATIDTTSNEQYASLSDNAFEIAMESFEKAKEIDPEGKKYYVTGDLGLPVLMDQQISGYYSYYYNEAVLAYRDKDYVGAVDNFEYSYTINPSDTNAYANAAYAAHTAELYERAKKNYRLAIDNGGQEKDLYTNYMNILVTQDEDKEAALALIDEALEKFPNDTELLKNRVSFLIDLKKTDEALADLQRAIDAEPDNANLHFTKGVLYENMGEKDKAIAAYKKGIEVDPDNFESNFNYGVLLINEANDIIKESNNLGMSKADQKKARELAPVIDQKLEEALPQWEKIYEIDSSDQVAIETLAYIYTQLGMKEKAKAMNDKLD